MAWEAIPTSECEDYDYSSGTRGLRERLKTALAIVGMSLIGVGIGGLFIFTRWVMGMENGMR